KCKWIWAAAVAAIVVTGVPMRAQDQPIVVQGGTLIDGTGRAPVKNAVVVIEGNRFKAVGTKGKVTIPPNAKIINATGKTIMPGLIDTQAQGDWWYQPPFWLHFGVTSIYFNGSPYMRQRRQLQQTGKMVAPRIYLNAGIIDAPP